MSNKIEIIEVLKWAFEKGYGLGCDDTREGIHINFAETQKFFLAEFAKFNAQNEQLDIVVH
jgi:hypothetical protein